MEVQEFEKSKIFEKLEFKPEPPGYTSKIPWIVQQQIAATNGIHFVSSIGKLTEYPIPNIPIQPAKHSWQLFLDIGCGWGRWLVAGANKGYIPIGIDFRLEFCNTSREVMQANGVNGYTVVADLKELPFKNSVFDAVWSFSVIQHTHKERLKACIADIAKILKEGGFCKLEFPNRHGLRNRLGPVITASADKDNYNSWCVRYYTVKEYRELFMHEFGNFDFENHSFLGIGILDNDLDYIRDKKIRMQVKTSLLLSKATRVIPFMKYISDSIYISSTKKDGGVNNDAMTEFIAAHQQNSSQNRNIFSLLCCPITRGNLIPDESGNFLISPKASKKFPVINNIPILVRSQAEQL